MIPKKWWKEKLFLSSQSMNVIYPNEENMFMVPNMKKKRLLHASIFVTIDKITFIAKNGGRKTISHQAKASVSFIPIRRMYLWCPVMKKRDYYVRPCLS